MWSKKRIFIWLLTAILLVTQVTGNCMAVQAGANEKTDINPENAFEGTEVLTPEQSAEAAGEEDKSEDEEPDDETVEESAEAAGEEDKSEDEEPDGETVEQRAEEVGEPEAATEEISDTEKRPERISATDRNEPAVEWKECIPSEEAEKIFEAIALDGYEFEQSVQTMQQVVNQEVQSLGKVITVASELDMLALARMTYEGEDFAGVTIKQVADIHFCNPFPGLILGVENESYHGFQGTYDGNGYVLRQLTSTTGVGLFHHIGVNGYVKNVTIINENVSLQDISFAPLADVNSGVIENYRFEGDMTIQSTKGTYCELSGCVWLNTGIIRNSIVDGSLSLNIGTGAGFANLNYGGRITNCYNACNITVSVYTIFVGGIAGETGSIWLNGTEEVMVQGNAFPRYVFPADTDDRIRVDETEYGTFRYLIFEIEHCCNYGTIRFEKENGEFGVVGGIAGDVLACEVLVDVGRDVPACWQLWGGMVSDCMNFGEVSSAKGDAGGIAGYGDQPIKNCGNFAKVRGEQAAGGIVAQLSLFVDWIQEMPEDIRLSECFNVGEVVSMKYGGGIIGIGMGGDCQNCYNTGSITAMPSADEKISLGGIAGHTWEDPTGLRNLYSAGTVEQKGLCCNGIFGSYDSSRVEELRSRNIYYLQDKADYGLYDWDKKVSVAMGGVTDEWLKSTEACSVLGECFAEDKNKVNHGYPVLRFQGAKENRVLVQFRTFGGDEVEPLNLLAGEKIARPGSPAKENSSFLGWYEDAACSKEWSFDLPVSKPMCLYAKWSSPEEKGTALVTVDTDGGSYDSALGYPKQFGLVKGSRLEEIEEPVKIGYEFKGWGINGSSSQKWNFASDTVTEDVTLKAIWEKRDLLTIRYEFCGADNFVGETYMVDYYQYASTLVLPVVTRKNYEFGGWFSEKGGKGLRYVENTRVYESCVWYAYWIGNARYRVTFDSQGGTPAEAVEGIKPDTCIHMPVPTKENCLFAGWFTEKNGEGERYTDDTPITHDVMLYAYWRENLVVRDYCVSAIDNRTYTGEAVRPEVSVYKNDRLLPEEEYTLTYINCVKPGKASVRIRIKEDGFVLQQFYMIDAKRIDEQDVDITVQNTLAVAGGRKPAIPQTALFYGKHKLLLNRDYKVTVTECTKGKGRVKIAGIGDYAGTVEKSFAIVSQSIAKAKVTPVAKQTYTGEEIKPVLEIKAADGSLLAENRDYVCYYSNHINAGTAKVLIQGTGSYAGTKTVSFTIAKKPIGDSTITVQAGNCTYNGKAQKTEVKVTDNGKELVYQKDYTLKYFNNKNVSDKAGITICGKGNYAGKRQTFFTILPKDINSLDIQVQDVKYVPGKELKGKVTIKDGTMVLRINRDYKVSYRNHTQLGSAEALLEGNGNYTGKLVQNYRIAEDLMEGIQISKVQPPVYNGELQKPVFTLMRDGQELVENKDYMVELLDPASRNAGQAKLRIRGCGKYGGSSVVSYRITKLPLDSANKDFVLEAPEAQIYTGKALRPDIVLYYKNVRLEQGKDYTLQYRNNVNASADSRAGVVVKGKGNFSGSLYTEFTVCPAKISDTTVKIPDVAYKKGSPAVPKVTVCFGKKVLKANRDYKVLYEPETECRDSAVKLMGIGNFAGMGVETVVVPYHIYEVPITRAVVSPIPRQFLAEEGIAEPAVKVQYQGEILKEGTDYTLLYENNDKPGNGKVTVKGIGRFGGEKKLVFVLSK